MKNLLKVMMLLIFAAFVFSACSKKDDIVRGGTPDTNTNSPAPDATATPFEGKWNSVNGDGKAMTLTFTGNTLVQTKEGAESVSGTFTYTSTTITVTFSGSGGGTVTFDYTFISPTKFVLSYMSDDTIWTK